MTSTHDLDALKLANPLLGFLMQEGLVFKRVGAGVHTALCPFHSEKTPSFRVTESTNRYHCFGCGESGDIFDWLDKKRGMTLKEAIAHLAQATPGLHHLNARLDLPPPPKPVEEAPLLPLKDSRYQAWLIACEKLAQDERELKRLADWRGFSIDTFRGAARAGLMALWRYWDSPREAFLVLAPRSFFTGLPSEPQHSTPPPLQPPWPPSTSPSTASSSSSPSSACSSSVASTSAASGSPSSQSSTSGPLSSPSLLVPQSPPLVLLPHAFHCRLAPETPGNPHKKQSWRYDPAGSKAWPFFWGNPFGARYYFILEGQWDALALADLCGWHSPESMPPQTCIIGLRGATSWRLLLHKEHGLPIDPEAAAICIGDADVAGAKWYDPDGFLATLRPKVKQLITFRPTTPGCKDFNDLTRGGHLTAVNFLGWVKARLKRHPFRRPPPPLTFGAWCKKAALREDELGRAARLVATDEHRPRGRKAPKHWRSYWRALPDLSEPDLLLLYRLLDTWKTRASPETATLAE